MPKDELIAALEAATGPDRELDADIYEALTGKCSHRHIMVVSGDGDGWGEVCSRCCEEEPYQEFKSFTASIDAALTLVDASWGDWHLSRDSLHKYEAAVWACGSRYIATGKEATCHQGYHETSPAIALCIAALRATERGDAGR